MLNKNLKKRRTIEPLIQLNPLFEQGQTIDTLIDEKVLYPACARIFRRNKSADNPVGDPLFLHKYQEEAVRIANAGHSYVLMTGTSPGKSLAYIRIMCCQHPQPRSIAEITKSIYRRASVLRKESYQEENIWNIQFASTFYMTNDADSLRTREQLNVEGWYLSGNVFYRGDERYLPLYEAKMMHQYGHRLTHS